MSRKSYHTDLKDKEWVLIEEHFVKEPKKAGRPIKHSRREILDAIFYVGRTGCQWRYLPHDFPPWKTVYEQYRRWKKQGVIERMNYSLTTKYRLLIGRSPERSAGVVDSQSVKTTEKGGVRGYDGGKKNQRQEKTHYYRYSRSDSKLLCRASQ